MQTSLKLHLLVSIHLLCLKEKKKQFPSANGKKEWRKSSSCLRGKSKVLWVSGGRWKRQVYVTLHAKESFLITEIASSLLCWKCQYSHLHYSIFNGNLHPSRLNRPNYIYSYTVFQVPYPTKVSVYLAVIIILMLIYLLYNKSNYYELFWISWFLQLLNQGSYH